MLVYLELDREAIWRRIHKAYTALQTGDLKEARLILSDLALALQSVCRCLENWENWQRKEGAEEKKE